ncbi:hypothetical protein E2P86_08960 [Sphingobacterium psychroaquaticum]|uniref:hypothetical protein n=1 Tax=Sphingobacterium psychroaquaticum TaxID=561061 RepID=UPI00106A4896|nr:hypothetical protein [Sphingobacterium psychroaquaticum]QBQ41278.1 hypothetical protein E2P86_08960 [Sphingobacterium psychroaquaticum]
MTLQEAKELLVKNDNLVGTTIENFYVEYLVIVPSKEHRIPEILFRKSIFEKHDDILDKYDDFDVLAIDTDGFEYKIKSLNEFI